MLDARVYGLSPHIMRWRNTKHPRELKWSADCMTSSRKTGALCFSPFKKAKKKHSRRDFIVCKRAALNVLTLHTQLKEGWWCQCGKLCHHCAPILGICQIHSIFIFSSLRQTRRDGQKELSLCISLEITSQMCLCQG